MRLPASLGTKELALRRPSFSPEVRPGQLPAGCVWTNGRKPGGSRRRCPMAAGGGRWLLDAARQRSIRGAMVARLHLFPTCLPPHKPDLASNKKDRVWLPQKRSCPRSPTPPTFLFTTAKKWNCLSLTRLQQMWSRAFPDAGAGDRCCASSRVVPSGLPEGVWCWFPPSNLSGNPCCCTGTLVKMEEYFTPPFFYQCT